MSENERIAKAAGFGGPFAAMSYWSQCEEHPGPTMCQAIYGVLCGEDGK